jgi:hypothetical protein
MNKKMKVMTEYLRIMVEEPKSAMEKKTPLEASNEQIYQLDTIEGELKHENETEGQHEATGRTGPGRSA